MFEYLAIFGVVAATAVGAIAIGEYAAGRDPLGCNYRKAEPYAKSGQRTSGTYQAPNCGSPKSEKEYELCQQRRAAGAAEDAACIAWWQAWSSAVGLVALIISVIYAGRSAEAAREAAQAASLNARAIVNAERSFLDVIIESENISIDITKVVGQRLGAEWDAGHISNGFTVQYHFRNFGKVPATFTDRSHEIEHAEDGLATEPRYFPIPLPKELVIAAGDRSETMTCRFRGNLTLADAMSVASGDTAIYFYGRVKYIDAVSPGPHERRFIWFYAGHGFHRSHQDNYHMNS